jgi:RNA repair, ligase-Pnkp-associating, region of Hen1
LDVDPVGLVRGQLKSSESATLHQYVNDVLDAEKHYWGGSDEVDKLLEKGEGWLGNHPERDTIVSRYLRFDRKLTSSALARLTDEDTPDPEGEEIGHAKEEAAIEAPLKLWEQRIGTILSALRSLSAKTVIALNQTTS